MQFLCLGPATLQLGSSQAAKAQVALLEQRLAEARRDLQQAQAQAQAQAQQAQQAATTNASGLKWIPSWWHLLCLRFSFAVLEQKRVEGFPKAKLCLHAS